MLLGSMFLLVFVGGPAVAGYCIARRFCVVLLSFGSLTSFDVCAIRSCVGYRMQVSLSLALALPLCGFVCRAPAVRIGSILPSVCLGVLCLSMFLCFLAVVLFGWSDHHALVRLFFLEKVPSRAGDDSQPCSSCVSSRSRLSRS